ncbi:helix-turn-helix domain-containing protein [Solimonas variicoloris]|uniref:helix-turn-helix domain-containing protein n=1 Tax=Solimonas variicoloris TaxID=254408 RepID=UPI0003782DDE|nr:helix-turn-helix domain-containing protein [Solimonas variicoloris]
MKKMEGDRTSRGETRGDAARLLEGVGLTLPEQQAYRALLRQPGSCLTDLARALGIAQRRVQRLLTDLELKGLVTHSPERVRRYLPTPPDIAVEALILHRQEELQRTRLAIAGLQEEMQKSAAAAPREQQIVEMLAGPASAQSYQQMQRSAQSEMLCLVRPPFLSSSPNRVDELRLAATRRGVKYRNIYDPAVLELPGWLAEARRSIEAGEDVRVLSNLPGKLIIADRRIGLLPLNLQQPDGPVLLVRPSSLLDALCELFEMMWQRAAPISFTRHGELQIDSAEAGNAETDRLVALLAAGLNDKAITHELGISARTLHRRLMALEAALNARTRFQAGWQAALRTFGLREPPR